MRKRKTYGTLAIDLESGKTVDMIDSRTADDVATWLEKFKNIELVSRDGSNVYKNAINKTFPKAIQISDRFHLLKNLSDYAKKEIYQVMAHKETIIYRSKKDNEQYVKPVNKGDKPLTFKMKERLKLIKAVKKRYQQCGSIRQVAREFKMSKITVGNYIKGFIPDLSNNKKKPLEKYKEEIISLISENKKTVEIHNWLLTKGINTKYSNTRAYVEKIKKENPTNKHPKYIYQQIKKTIYRKDVIKLLYNRGINDIGLSEDNQNDLKSYLKTNIKLQEIINLSDEFRILLFSKNPKKLNLWINKINKSGFKFLKSIVIGIEKDYDAVVNSITLDYSNGKIEGKINKLKNIKRQMYGRCSFALLKNKFFLATNQPY